MNKESQMYYSAATTCIFNSPNFKKIPNHALTHYVSDIYATYNIKPTTKTGFIPKPKIQRKESKSARPVIASAQIITQSVSVKPKAKQGKFRKNINKAALAKYFDNDVLPLHAEIAQEKLDTWLMQTMFELENADIARAEQDVAERQELIAFVESSRKMAILKELLDEHNKRILMHMHKNNPANQNRISINEHKIDIFEKKIARSSQMRSMIKLHHGQFRRDKRNQIYKDFLSRQK